MDILSNLCVLIYFHKTEIHKQITWKYLNLFKDTKNIIACYRLSHYMRSDDLFQKMFTEHTNTNKQKAASEKNRIYSFDDNRPTTRHSYHHKTELFSHSFTLFPYLKRACKQSTDRLIYMNASSIWERKRQNNCLSFFALPAHWV